MIKIILESITVVLVLTFFLSISCSNEHDWEETIYLAQNLIITDTIRYELENAILIADKKIVCKSLLDKIIEFKNIMKSDSVDYAENDSPGYFQNSLKMVVINEDSIVEVIMLNEEDTTVHLSSHLYLLNHLDTTSGNYYLNNNDSFKSKPDTISVGLHKANYGYFQIEDGDWKRDTIIVQRDYSDKRNYYFDSMERVFTDLISKNEVLIINKKTGDFEKSIKLKHSTWEINNYLSHYEFKNGDYIVMKEWTRGL